MARIHILGTSNSVIGQSGYVEALRLRHEVTNRSAGRNGFAYHISQILQHRATIEASDLLIVDHYGNDTNLYRGVYGARYPRYLESFYQLLATLNLPVVNVMFPRRVTRYPKVRGMVRDMADRYGITTLDLSDAGFRPEHFLDPYHIDRHASYMLGIFLGQAVARLTAHRPQGGSLTGCPFRVIPACDIAPDLPLRHFSNSIADVDYVLLDRECPLPLRRGERVISVGYFRDFDQIRMQGFRLDDQARGIAPVPGVYQEVTSLAKGARSRIAPLLGRHADVKVMARRQRIGGRFVPPGLVNVLAVDPSARIEATFADHRPVTLVFEDLVAAIDGALTRAGPALAARRLPARPGPSAVEAPGRAGPAGAARPGLGPGRVGLRDQWSGPDRSGSDVSPCACRRMIWAVSNPASTTVIRTTSPRSQRGTCQTRTARKQTSVR